MQQGLLELGCHDVPSCRQITAAWASCQVVDVRGGHSKVDRSRRSKMRRLQNMRYMYGSAKAAADIWNVHSAKARPVLPPQARPAELSCPGLVQFEESVPFAPISAVVVS